MDAGADEEIQYQMFILDILLQALEDRAALDRAELAKALINAIAKADGEPETHLPAAVFGRNLLRAFVTLLPQPKASRPVMMN